MRRLGLSAALILASTGSAAGSGPYVGSEASAPCHREEYDRQGQSRHAHALRPISQSPLSEVLLAAGLVDGQVRYEARGKEILVTAGRNGEEAAGILEWAFGAGAQGITPVGHYGGRFFEHRLSYYSAARRLAPTFGHPERTATPASELGIPQSAHTIASCFKCHATGVEEGSDGPELSGMEPGVRCERCHGPGREHVTLAKARGPAAEIRHALLNPGRLNARAQIEVCGGCHRLPAPGAIDPEPEMANPVSVRFAPVGLLASRCFIESKRLACAFCHDPHSDARARIDAFYAARCLSCHSNPAKAGALCRRNTGENCLPCHMRQASLSPYLKFTDHRIRIY